MTPEERAIEQAELAARYAQGDKPDDMRQALMHALSAIVILARSRAPGTLF